MASKSGYIKKTALSAFANLRRAGLRALTIEESDDLVGAEICETGNEVLLSTKKGMACRFDQNNDQIRPMGRTARGVTGMRFKLEDDYIVGMEVIKEVVSDVDESSEAAAEAVGPELLVVTEKGMGKRSLVGAYRKTKRGAKGVTSVKLRSDDTVISALQVIPGDELMLTTERGQLVRIPCDEIRTIGRASFGVRIMNLKEDDNITGISKIVKVEGEESESETDVEADTGEEVSAEAVATEAETPDTETTE